MTKGNRKRGKEKVQLSTSKDSHGGGGGGSDSEMLVDEPILPYLSCQGSSIFESIPTEDRSVPYMIHYGTELDKQMVEVCETTYPTATVPMLREEKLERKILQVVRYEYRLSELFDEVSITRYVRGQGKGNTVLMNFNRELIKGIVKEFCRVTDGGGVDDPKDGLYLRHSENYVISGYKAYTHQRELNNDILNYLDEIHPEVNVHFVSFKRSGACQKYVENMLLDLKDLLLRLNVGDPDPEWKDFLSKLNKAEYKDAPRHSYLWHWDQKLDFFDYIHRKLNLNGPTIRSKAKSFFTDVPCLDGDWEARLRADPPIDRICKAKVSVDHYDEMVEDPTAAGGQGSGAGGGQSSSAGGQGIIAGGHGGGQGSRAGGQVSRAGGQGSGSQGSSAGSGLGGQGRSAGGQVSRAGGQGSGGQGSSAGGQVSRAGGQGSSKGKGRHPTPIENIQKVRCENGARLISIVRNSIMHVSHGRWVKRGDFWYYEYDNLRTGFTGDDCYKDPKYLYARLKLVLPQLWSEMVPVARRKGFDKY